MSDTGSLDPLVFITYHTEVLNRQLKIILISVLCTLVSVFFLYSFSSSKEKIPDFEHAPNMWLCKTWFRCCFIFFQADHVFWGPAAIFALLNIICTIILLTLPETMGRELPTTVEEMKSWVKDKKGTFDVRRPKHYLKVNRHHR